ncbi:MAG: hypothetical protein SPG64_01930 [Candidatus Enteromonas sp.]|nr:hypothetical protein [Candidatus Enteromonas sp.]
MKSKTLGILIASMASVALMGAGFSSWVISGVVDSTEVYPVSVTVGDVKDARVAVSATLTDGTIVFEAAGVTPAEDAVFKAEGSATQDLTAVVTIHVQAKSSAGTSKNVKVEWATTLPEIVKTKHLAALSSVTCKCGGEDVTVNENSSFVVAPTTEAKDYTLTYTFAWGTAFNSKNPVQMPASEVASLGADTIVDNLKTLKSAMEVSSAVSIDFTPSIVA